MRSSQGYRHTSRPARPALAREHHPGYDARHGAGPADVEAAIATILAGHDGAPLPDGELAELVATLRAADRLTARAVALAAGLDTRRAAAEEGMTCDGALRLHTGMVSSDVAMVLTASDVLATMPATAGLFARGVLSWGHVRQVATGVRRLDAATRTALDRHLAEHAGRLERLDPERRAWALEDAIDDHRPERALERQTERHEQVEFLALQGRLDGSGCFYGQYGPENFAAVTSRLEAEADTPQATPCPGDRGGPPEPAVTRGQQLAAALVRLCAGRTSGSGKSVGSPVRMSVIVDADRVTDRAAGHIVAGVQGRPPRIVRRALDRIACDAALDVVIRDGVDLLAARRYAPDVTVATRRAIAVRDGGCRFPGCTAPISWCDVHHVRPRAAETDPRATDGDHHVHNLVSLCRRHHTIVHRRGWHQTLDPDGTYRLRRRGRTWTTQPRHDQQLPPPDVPDAGAARAGPARARAGPAGRPRAGPNSDDAHLPSPDGSWLAPHAEREPEPPLPF